jgi:late competence protein required for DNA uptake (superfamily II DNA/RNA helicase)
MIKLIKNNNYVESYEKLNFINKIGLSNKYFKGSENAKAFIKSNSELVELEKPKPCVRCGDSFKRGRMSFNRFYCNDCLLPASHENAKTILKNTISESES